MATALGWYLVIMAEVSTSNPSVVLPYDYKSQADCKQAGEAAVIESPIKVVTFCVPTF